MKKSGLAIVLALTLAFAMNANAATTAKKKAKKAKAKVEQKVEEKKTEGHSDAAVKQAEPVAAAAPAADTVTTAQASVQTSETKLVERPSNLYWQMILNSPKFDGSTQGVTIWNRAGPKFALDHAGNAISVRPYFTVAPNTNKPGATLGDVEANLHLAKTDIGNGWTVSPYLRYMIPTGAGARAAQIGGNLQPRVYLEGTAGRMEFTYVLIPVLPIITASSLDGTDESKAAVVLSLGNSLRLSKLATVDLTVEPGVQGPAKGVTGPDAAAKFSLNTDVGFSLELQDGLKVSPYVEFDAADPKLSTTNFQTSVELTFL